MGSSITYSLIMLLLITGGQDNEFDGRIEQFDKLKFDHEYTEFYRAVFADCDSDQLATFARHENDSIGVQSAWELVRLSVLNGQKKVGVVLADQSKLNWFLGMFEGRNRVAIPTWWRDVVLNSQEVIIPGPEKLIQNIYPGEPTQRPYNKIKNWASRARKYPKDASLTVENGIVTYSTEKDSINIPKDLLEKAGSEMRNISCVFTEKLCYIAIHTDFGFSHPVACIDRATNSVIWTTKACGCAYFANVTESWVTLVATGDGRIFCFGYVSCGVYAHAFDASNGRSLFQFSTNF